MSVQFITRTAILLALTMIFQSFRAPQLFHFLFGIMKFPPMIPFIMIGNALYVLVFSGMKNKPVGMVLGSLVKFLWLSASVYYMLPLFGVKAPAVLVEMFTFPQLATAVMGGILALLVLSLLKKSLLE